MPLGRLSVTDLRNLARIDIEPSTTINLICGPNASGKTSLLEAVHLLGRGRSFRTNRHTNLIRRGARETTLYGEVVPVERSSTVSIGLTKAADGEQQLKIAGEIGRSYTKLLRLLPLQLIVPDSFDLLTGGPRGRREFIDWGVFHVEHRFLGEWQMFKRCLKQRNSLLKQASVTARDVAVWNRELLERAQAITGFRARYVERLLPVVHSIIEKLIRLDQLAINFYPGWDIKRGLEATLEEGFERDKQQGFTQSGPHRADLRMRYLGQRASDTLSRGQQKLVVAALKVAQGQLFTQSTGRFCVYLIDDLAAELDEPRRIALCHLLSGIGSQIFVTGVDQNDFRGCWEEQEVKLFHVKHGIVRPEN